MAVSGGGEPHFEAEELYLGKKLRNRSAEICRSVSSEGEWSEPRVRQAAEKELEGRGGVSVGRIPFVVVAVCSQREMHAALQKTVRFGINAAEGREKDTVSESGEKRKLWSVLFLFFYVRK